MSNIDIENIKNKTGVEIVYAEENIRYINSKTIPNRCGAYIITTKTGKRYIGMSSNMYNRMMTHSLGGYIEEPIEFINIYIAKNGGDARCLERWLIYELDPELNRSKPISFDGKIKTVQIEDDVYFLMAEKRSEIFKKYGVNITIPQMIIYLVKNGIDHTEELLFRIPHDGQKE